jgi:cysteine desulfurase
MVYLDNHATTMVDPRVVRGMLPYFSERYGNAASRQHEFGWVAEAAVERGRKQVAALLQAEPEEIFFTSGATESINLAIRGVGEALAARGRHIVTAATEHRAVLDTLQQLEKYGFSITRLGVDSSGMVDPEEVRRSLRRTTVLVSIMAANNEIGTLAPLREIGAICREHQVLFHSDAAQAAGTIPLDLKHLPVDLLSLTAHKMHGPKGIGALYVARTAMGKLAPQITGGGHEHGLRSGTLNVPGIVGFGLAAQIAQSEPDHDRIGALRDRLIEGLRTKLTGITVNGHPERRLPGNASVTFSHARADRVMLEMKDIAVSTGSACSSASAEPSHVLRALGLSGDASSSTIRFGLSRFTTEEEIDYAIERVSGAVNRVRARALEAA